MKAASGEGAGGSAKGQGGLAGRLGALTLPPALPAASVNRGRYLQLQSKLAALTMTPCGLCWLKGLRKATTSPTPMLRAVGSGMSRTTSFSQAALLMRAPGQGGKERLTSAEAAQHTTAEQQQQISTNLDSALGPWQHP